MAGTPGTAASFAERLARAFRNLHVADLVVLTIVGGSVLDASARVLSAPTPFVQAVLIIACTAAAARRLVAWRYGRSQPISIEGPSQTLAVVAGVAPWLLLPLLRQPFQNWPLSASLAFPLSLRVVGACLIMSGVFGPFWLGLRPSGAPVRVSSYVLIGLFLFSSSPLVGVLTTGWLAIRWSVDRAQRALTPPLIRNAAA